MVSRRIDAEIDRLYQLPPEEFTAARNALAKGAGADAAEIRALAKPPLPAWAVNQLYWTRRPLYDELIEASAEVRKIHKAILGGRRADLRDAAKAHDAAIDAALKAALGILKDSGHPATDASRQAIATTLRALPADDPPGRLARVLQPGGFEMLAGLSVTAGSAPRGPVARIERKDRKAEPAQRPAPAQKKEERAEKKKPDARELAQAREAAAAAARELRAAEHEARRVEFEAARTAREAEKALKERDRAREALEAARRELQEAEGAATAAERSRDSAARRSTEAEQVLEAARGRVKQTDAAVAKLKGN